MAFCNNRYAALLHQERDIQYNTAPALAADGKMDLIPKTDDQIIDLWVPENPTVKEKSIKDGHYSDPVYKKISLVNGEINRMTKEQLKAQLEDQKLDSRGVKEVLKKRLKNYYKRQKLLCAHIRPPGGTHYDFMIVIDFEATCDENNTHFKHEIIEFPIILIDVHQIKVVDEFHAYCKPSLNPRLTPFCSKLTGITQDTVNVAKPFPEVFADAQDWLASKSLGHDYKFAVVTDGPWDMSRFLLSQCNLSKLEFPKWAKKWINIRKSYGNFYQCRRSKLEMMLQNLGLHFEGHLHSGLDDSRNIARIALRLLSDGCMFKVNEFLRCNANNHQLNPEVQVVPQTGESDVSDDDEEDEHALDGVLNPSGGHHNIDESMAKLNID